MEPTGVLAAFVAGFDEKTLDGEIVSEAIRGIRDFVGVALAGSMEPAARLLQESTGLPPGPCTILGGGTTSEVMAALFNGAAGHALDFDDSHDALGGHPSVVVLPAVWAVAESVQATPRQMLAAYVLGVEVSCKLGRALNFRHYERGWHPTATLGVFGAAAGVAWLLGLPQDRVQTAMGIAASLASGTKGNFGTMMKPIQVGLAAQKGVMAARWAEMGITANREVLSTKYSFSQVFQSESGVYDILDRLGRPYEIWDPGLVIKLYPCCGSTHPAVDAVLELRRSVDDIASVESIDILLHPRRLAHTNRPTPQSGLEGKFSVQYAAAAAWVRGWVGIGDFTDEAVQRPDVQAIVPGVHAAPLPEERWGPEHFASEVTVTLRTGQSLHKRVEKAHGRGRLLAVTDDELYRKFESCASRVLDARRVKELWDRLGSLENASTLDELVPAMQF